MRATPNLAGLLKALAEVARTAPGEQHILMLWVPVDNEMGVRCDRDAVELTVHHPLPYQPRQAGSEVALGPRKRAPFDQPLIVRQVNLERESSRYCPNLSDHCHFQDEKSGKIHDVVFKEGVKLEDILELPKGTEVSRREISLKGIFGK